MKDKNYEAFLRYQKEWNAKQEAAKVPEVPEPLPAIILPPVIPTLPPPQPQVIAPTIPYQPVAPAVEVEKKKPGLWEKMFSTNRLNKGNTIAVVYLRANGKAEPLEVEVRNGMFTIDNKTYHENRECVHTLGKERYPFAIVDEWSVTPRGTKVWEERGMQEKFSILQDHVMKGIRHAERVRMGEAETKKMNPKAWITIGILAIVAIAVLMNFGGGAAA